ncbi:MAG: hypothetical protein B7Z23_00725 [Pseudomonadales bacterium 32-61-5]|nr:MAG: hypothetical protein B7Z23_00725 [Pseudomonadales bacterium 32-61-5]
MEATIVKTLDVLDCREVGAEATFTISSAKPGNGVEQLRDNNLDTYWQSDGAFPHTINVQFLKRASVSKLCLYLDYSTDESYTPKKISVSSGTCLHDLIDISTVELTEPNGWVTIDLNEYDLAGTFVAEEDAYIRTHFLQVKVLAMHQNGRDTHIRQIKVLGPREAPRVVGDYSFDKFQTIDMQQFSVIR